MINSIYQLFMRWVYSQLYPLISPHLHQRQFGGRQGVCTAHATQIFLDDLDKLGPIEAILAFDVYHAFDSPSKVLIRDVLDKMGTPLKLLRIITLVMERGSTFLRGAEQEIFRAAPRVKQGCPLSVFSSSSFLTSPCAFSTSMASPSLHMSMTFVPRPPPSLASSRHNLSSMPSASSHVS